jgi:hypothetical protein
MINFAASSLLRMGKEPRLPRDTTITGYPNEMLDTAHLNIIDGYRESRRSGANLLIDRTRQKFVGTPTETSDFRAIRLDIALAIELCGAERGQLSKPISKIPTRARRSALFKRRWSAGVRSISVSFTISTTSTRTTVAGDNAAWRQSTIQGRNSGRTNGKAVAR